MTKCPECGNEIGYLKNYVSGEKIFLFYPDGEYSEDGYVDDEKTNDYECPECQKTLFTDEQEALDFLRGVKK